MALHTNYYEPTEQELKAYDDSIDSVDNGCECYVCGVFQEESAFVHHVFFLYKPHKRDYISEPVCSQCYPDLVNGEITTIYAGSECYAYRGRYVSENNKGYFIPHSLVDGKLVRLQSDEGYFSCETDIPLFRRWKVGEELKRYRW